MKSMITLYKWLYMYLAIPLLMALLNLSLNTCILARWKSIYQTRWIASVSIHSIFKNIFRNNWNIWNHCNIVIKEKVLKFWIELFTKLFVKGTLLSRLHNYKRLLYIFTFLVRQLSRKSPLVIFELFALCYFVCFRVFTWHIKIKQHIYMTCILSFI